MTREEALKILKSWDGYMFLEREEGNVGYSYKKDVSQEAINVAIEALEQSEERQQGEWVRTALYGQTCYECNNCHLHYDITPNYCPNCGADMRKGGADIGARRIKNEKV